MKQFNLNVVHSCTSFDFNFTDFLLLSFCCYYLLLCICI